MAGTVEPKAWTPRSMVEPPIEKLSCGALLPPCGTTIERPVELSRMTA